MRGKKGKRREAERGGGEGGKKRRGTEKQIQRWRSKRGTSKTFSYYRKRGSASYIVREVRSVRERDTEREREIDGSDVTLVALKLAKKFALFLAKTLKLPKNFALFLAKTLHLSFSPHKWRWVHTFLCHKRCTIRNSRNLPKIRTLRDRFTSVKWRDRESKHRNKRSNFRLHRPFFSSKNWIKLIPKTIGNRKKRLCVRLRSGDKHHLRKSSDQIEKHKSGRRSFRSPDWFVLFDLKIFPGGVYPPSATSRTISFFYFQ